MKNKILFSFFGLCLSAAAFGQTATTSGKTPAQEPARNESSISSTEQKTVSNGKNAVTEPAPAKNEQQQNLPVSNDKATSQEKKPE